MDGPNRASIVAATAGEWPARAIAKGAGMAARDQPRDGWTVDEGPMLADRR